MTFCIIGTCFFETPQNISKQLEDDILRLHFDAYLPQRFSLSKHQVCLVADGTKAKITIPVLRRELKYFFENYREYYYLPVEDTAIHKSVAVYMDKSYRQRAGKENCYQKMTGSFLPTFGYDAQKTFGRNYHERKDYMEASVFHTPEIHLAAYTAAVLQWLQTSK